MSYKETLEDNSMKSVNNTQNKTFNRETEILKKTQTEILEVRNAMSEMKNAVESTNSRHDQSRRKNL